MGREHVKAIGLLSGGLDSTLALRIVRDMGVEVLGLNFTGLFCTCTPKTAGCAAAAVAAATLGIEVRTRSSTERLLSLLRDPPHGHGSCLNPCIDCRIGMFREALDYMRETGARFIVTGEVLGERPMSQRREAMELIDRESGAGDLVVRPLSAQLIRPSLPERKGWVDRGRMLAMSGRSRRPQIALARELGIDDYPCPAGGCRLSEPGFAGRMLDLLQHTDAPIPPLRDVSLLRLGRHFRLSRRAKAIVGRNEEENGRLSGLVAAGDVVMEPVSEPGPLVLVGGNPVPADLELAREVTACYTAGDGARVEIETRTAGSATRSSATALARKVADRLRIRSLQPGWRKSVSMPIAPHAIATG